MKTDSELKDDSIDGQTTMKQSSNGCCRRAIRALWATRQTEDIKDRERYIKVTLRELLLYLLFVSVLCIVTFGMTTTTMFYYTNVLSRLFIDTPLHGDSDDNFRSMTTTQQFWKFMTGALLDGLYWEKWYNGQNLTEDQIGYILYENKIQGVPRIRQLRVRNDSCKVHDDFKDIITQCFDVYSPSVEDMTWKSLSTNNTAWTYQSEEQLEGSSHWGQISKYGGGGYVQDLYLTRIQSELLLVDLKNNLWIDRGTRAVFIDFTVYNANINLFCVIRLLIEFPAIGGVVTSYSFRTVKLIRYVNLWDYFILCCEIIFCLFIVYYIIEEIIEIRKHRLDYFTHFWNLMDIVILILAVCCIIFNVYRTMAVRAMLQQLLQHPDRYPDFEFLSYWQVVFNSVLAVNVFFTWVKVFKYISINKTMTQLSSTLARCAKDLISFAVMFFIIFLAFAQLGYLIFGTQVKDFSSFQNSIFTLFRIILGDFNFDDLQEANRVLGPLFFLSYVFFVFFVLLNMFLAIINDTYSEVKSDIALHPSEIEITDYLMRGVYHVMECFHLREPSAAAEELSQGRIPYKNFRNKMLRHGFTDVELETVMEKHGKVKNEGLTEDEVKILQNDLQSSKMSDEVHETRKMDASEDISRDRTILMLSAKLEALENEIELMKETESRKEEQLEELLELIVELILTEDVARRIQLGDKAALMIREMNMTSSSRAASRVNSATRSGRSSRSERKGK